MKNYGDRAGCYPSRVLSGLGRYSRPRAQFLPIRTSKSVNNIYLTMLLDEAEQNIVISVSGEQLNYLAKPKAEANN